MGDYYPEYGTKEARESLIEKLNLPELGPYTQDWEYEVSDASRISEFISFYENQTLSKEEKFTLMVIIVSSYDDSLGEGNIKSDVWDKIKYHLLNEINIHRNTILYWALDDEDLEDCFAITPFMRGIVKTNKEKF